MEDEEDQEEPEEIITRDGLVSKVEELTREFLENFRRKLDSCIPQVKEFLSGERDCYEFGSTYGEYTRNINFADLEKTAEGLLTSLEKLGREKGFRSNIKTYNEHQAIRSTVWGKYAEKPDVPLGVLNMLWQNTESGEALTIEEARKARELYGLTTLDENGAVTDRKNDAVKDSYYFLSTARRAEVIELEKNLLAELEALSKQVYTRKKELLEGFIIYLDDFISGKHTILDLLEKSEEVKGVTGIFGLDFSRTEPRASKNLLDQARELSYHEGYRDSYLTPQELTILGRPIDPKYLNKPWTPIGIQDGTLSIEDAKAVRGREKEIRWNTSVFNGFEMSFPIKLEELNADGETINGPNGTNAKMAQHFKDRANVPYSRPTDWYHKGS